MRNISVEGLLRPSRPGRARVVRLLLERGAYIEAKAEAGYTAFHVVTPTGFEMIVPLLLKR